MVMNTDEDKTSAYKQGCDAYLEGKSMSMLPYHRLSENGASWLRGWNTSRYFHMLSVKSNA